LAVAGGVQRRGGPGLGLDAERTEVSVVDAQRLDELVCVGLGVDVGAAKLVDPAGDDHAGRLGGDAVEVSAEDGPRVGVVNGLVDGVDIEGVDRVRCRGLKFGDVLLLDGDVVAGARVAARKVS